MIRMGMRSCGIALFALFTFLFLSEWGLAGEPILIGGTVSLEGKFKEPSWMMQQAFRLWEQQVNQRGGLLGRPVELVLLDDKSEVERAGELYEQLINRDRVDLILAPYGTPLTLTASEVTERHSMLMVAAGASGAEIWERGYQYVVGVYAPGSRYFIGFLDLVARQGLGPVAILHEKSSFCTDAARGAVIWAGRFNLNVALVAGYDNAASELLPLVQKCQEIRARSVLLSAYSSDVYEFLHHLSQKAYRPEALACTIAPVHPDFHKRAGNWGEGVFAPSQWEPDERLPFPGARQFIHDFASFSGTLPTYHAASAFASCQILERAVNHTRSLDQTTLLHYVTGLDTVTIIGRFRVNHHGEQVGHNPLTIQWQHGKKEIVYPIRMQTATPLFGHPSGE